MRLYDSVLHSIGHTPLVRLHRLAPPTGAALYAKLEFMNPGGSVKDRMALYIIEQAERQGLLKPGGTIVENTSGNTGVGLAMIGALKGYKLIFTIPDKMSDEKINALRAFGAKVVVTATAVPADSPDSYYETAKRIASETPGAFYVNQYHNQWNIEAHYQSTGPELWQDTDGQIDVAVIGVGTGGTISGVGRYLKERNPNIRIIGVDPVGSIYYSMFKTGKPSVPAVYKVEGIGEDMVCAALDMSVIDDMYQVTDRDCFEWTRRLVREEGIFAGGSSGGSVYIANKVAAGLSPDKKVVAILPDSANRYLSKIFNDDWMRGHGFLDDGPGTTPVGKLIEGRSLSLVTAQVGMTLREAALEMKRHDISQLPVLDGDDLVGMVSESAILRRLLGAPDAGDERVGDLADTRVPVVSPDTPVDRVADLFIGSSAVLVCEQVAGKPCKVLGLVTKIDLIDYLTTGS